jgi:ubiquinol-cytochrome c reductase cytochrome b subunit
MAMDTLKRAWRWFDDRTGTSSAIGPIAKHPAPPGSDWWYVFGSATLFAFILQAVTGVILALSYVPSAGEAYQSLQFISNDAFMGSVLRGMHFFGASAMVLLVGVHMARVFLMGVYKFPREMSWLSGTVLLLLTLGAAFTGQLLRWDQNAIWTAVVGAEIAGRVPLIGTAIARFILGGDVIGGATLTRFFSAHIFVIPGIIIGIVGFHLYLVLRNGISEPPQAGQPVDPKTYRAWYQDLLHRSGRPFWPDAAWRDAVFSAVMILVVVVLAVVFGAPQLTKPPDPTIVQALPRPDWYFLWVFALMALLPPATEGYIMIYGPLALGLVLILLPFLANRGERSPRKRPWAIGIVLIAVVMIITLGIAGERSYWSPDFSAQPLPEQVVAATSGPVADGAQLFYDKGCEYCHMIEGYGGRRGPNLSGIGNRLTPDEMTVRILNGGKNMPAFASILTPEQINALVAFLQSRRTP